MAHAYAVAADRPQHPKWACLSAEAYCFADKVLCWCLRRESEFVPIAILVALAGSRERADVLVAELVQAGVPEYEVGILEPTEERDGYLAHDAAQYWLTSEEFAAAHKRATDSVRQKRYRKRKKHGGDGPRHAERYGDVTLSVTEVSRGPLRSCHAERYGDVTQTVTRSRAVSEILDPCINKDSGCSEVVVPKTYQVVARAPGERPRLRPPLLSEPILVENWDVCQAEDASVTQTVTDASRSALRSRYGERHARDAFRAYGMELGLTAGEVDEVLVEFRDKCGHKPHTTEWLADMLCRFLEQGAKRKADRASRPSMTAPPQPSSTDPFKHAVDPFKDTGE